MGFCELMNAEGGEEQFDESVALPCDKAEAEAALTWIHLAWRRHVLTFSLMEATVC